MAITNKNTALLHRKEWQQMTPCPTTNAAGMFVISPQSSIKNISMYVCSATTQYLYHHDEDAWVQIPSGALAGAFAAGSCGVYHSWSVPFTANGGSTTTITVPLNTHNITSMARGAIVEFTNGANIGQRRTITQILTTGVAGSTITLTLDSALPTAVLSTNTFILDTGRFFVLNAYATLAAGVWKVFDLATMTWQANLATTNLPAAWGTDGKLATAARLDDTYETGTATIYSPTTIGITGKTWAVDQWINYQVRITAGTGLGQTRLITDSTATTLTVATWTVTPDSTSVFKIEGDENSVYLLGNNAVTMYKYNISANTWAILAPTVARAAAPGAGMSANHVGVTTDPAWADVNDIKDGRYIYSFRGAGVNTLSRFDIAGGTAGAGAWVDVTYPGAAETFTTGSSFDVDGKYIYCRQNATHRFFKFNIRGNYMEPLTTLIYSDGTATLGSKMWVKYLDPTGTVRWLYSMRGTATELFRLPLF